MKLIWKTKAIRQLQTFEKKSQNRIVSKMHIFLQQDNPLEFAEPLKNSELGTHRFRIGNYRVICELMHDQISILYVNSVRKRNEKTYK